MTESAAINVTRGLFATDLYSNYSPSDGAIHATIEQIGDLAHFDLRSTRCDSADLINRSAIGFDHLASTLGA